MERAHELREVEDDRDQRVLRLVPSADGDSELLPGMVGSSPPMRRLARRVHRLAAVDLPVLVRGESGSGKELVARALHALGPRARAPFVAINAATLHEGLCGSALFGHVRGAFTGAHESRLGAFRGADGGTLFLDEIGSLSAAVQPALLRVLDGGEVLAVGGDRGVAVDVRLVAATCEPLEDRVRRGLFRADLYERIAACVVRVPALRERLEDLEVLCEHALRAAQLGDHSLGPGTLALLRRHEFLGNVRELRNVLAQAALDADGGVIRSEDVRDVLCERTGERVLVTADRARALLDETRGNVSAAARRAGVARTTFRDLLRREELRRQESGCDQKLPATPVNAGVTTGMTFVPLDDEPGLSTK
jgi:DNA-binding NtrC family response regulator